MDQPVINGVEFNLSDRCNLACGFCYTRKGLGHGPDMARTGRVLDWFFGQIGPVVKTRLAQHPKWSAAVTIYGGEPLIEWDDLQAAVGLVADRGIPTRVGIVTNMTLLTAERLDWLIQHRVGIHPSIDGCPEAEDTHRHYPDGTGASATVYDNARRLIERQPGRSCRMTVSPETAHFMFESVRFLCEEIGFQTVNPILAGGCDWPPEILGIVQQEVRQITDWWIGHLREGKHYSIYHLRNMCKAIWASQRRRSLCHAGTGRVAVDTNGALWPCHRFCNLSSAAAYRLGTIDDGYTNRAMYDRLREYDMAAETKDRCARCPAVIGCHALCLHEMMLAGKGMFEPCEHYCRMWPFYWHEAMRAHAILTAEKNRTYLAAYQPRPQRRPQQRQRVRR